MLETELNRRYDVKPAITKLLLCIVFIMLVLQQNNLVDGQRTKSNGNEITTRIDVSSTPKTITKKPSVKPTKSSNKVKLNEELLCPGSDEIGGGPVRFPLLALPCETNKDCTSVLGPGQLCCPTTKQQPPKKNGSKQSNLTSRNSRCIQGVPRPEPEIKHAPLLGIIERKCPKDGQPYGELVSDVRECKEDVECGPLRICCADSATSGNNLVNAATSGGTKKKYCRAPAPRVEALPLVPTAAQEPLKTFMSYLQCTPPPPPILDLFPKPCKNMFDCFPNLCCQETGGKRHCRPPKRSVLALIAGFTQRFGGPIRDRLIANQKRSLGL